MAQYNTGKHKWFDGKKLWPVQSLITVPDDYVPSRTWKALDKPAEVALAKRLGKLGADAPAEPKAPAAPMATPAAKPDEKKQKGFASGL